ncbi:threonine/serine exporter ThrE family protein [Demequina sp. NBRC 110053]|uniref:threonine/serine ThrE exporter family protein n=1 Tax=Demequina sp. NBRC 110053 TaxID=1570342 RepID=UPI00135664A7|nr:threonine/serine exporter family protein [Demequina sp. NBRC 110053]
MSDIDDPDDESQDGDERVRAAFEMEESLEPVSLIEQSRVVIRTGQLMLAAGTASYRVRQAMRAVAAALGVDHHANHVSMTDIAATSHRGRIFRTEVAENTSFAVNADRLAGLDRMRRTLPARTTPEEVNRALDAIEGRGPLYPGVANSAFAGFACAAFAVLNHAHAWEVAAVFIAAALGQWTRRALAHRHFNAFGTTMAAAAVSTGLYVLAIAGIGLGVDQVETHAAGYISSVLYLLPGFALITGALDMAKMDLQAGIQRIAFGTMITMAAGVSVWLFALIEPLSTASRPDADVSSLVQVVVWAAASGIGVLGFALMFNSPWRMAAIAAGIGAIANTGRLLAVDRDAPVQAATAVACLVVGVLAAGAAGRGRFPVITLSVPAVLVMIPGVAAHEALVSLNAGQYTAATAGVLEVTLVVLAIMVGLVVAKLLTDREWASTATR